MVRVEGRRGGGGGGEEEARESQLDLRSNTWPGPNSQTPHPARIKFHTSREGGRVGVGGEGGGGEGSVSCANSGEQDERGGGRGGQNITSSSFLVFF